MNLLYFKNQDQRAQIKSNFSLRGGLLPTLFLLRQILRDNERKKITPTSCDRGKIIACAFCFYSRARREKWSVCEQAGRFEAPKRRIFCLQGDGPMTGQDLISVCVCVVCGVCVCGGWGGAFKREFTVFSR